MAEAVAYKYRAFISYSHADTGPGSDTLRPHQLLAAARPPEDYLTTAGGFFQSPVMIEE
jgi:hypothetical protein